MVSRPMRMRGFWLAAILVVALDQLSKAWVRANLPLGRHTGLIPHLLGLVHVRNTGAAFSMGEGAGMVFVGVALAVTVVCAVTVWRRWLPLTLVVPLGCIVGGGIGNMIDRLGQGFVTDFLSLDFVSFPIFNVADCFVTVGIVVAFIVWLMWDARHQIKETPARKGSAA